MVEVKSLTFQEGTKMVEVKSLTFQEGTKVVEVKSLTSTRTEEEAAAILDSSDDDEVGAPRRLVKSSSFTEVLYSSDSSEDELTTDNARTQHDSRSDGGNGVSKQLNRRRSSKSSFRRVADEWSSVREVGAAEVEPANTFQLLKLPWQYYGKGKDPDKETSTQLNDADEKVKWMAAAKATEIPSDDDSFGDDSDGSSHPATTTSRSVAGIIGHAGNESWKKRISPITIPNHPSGEKLDSDSSSSSLNDPSESESSASDEDNADKVLHEQRQHRNAQTNRRYKVGRTHGSRDLTTKNVNSYSSDDPDRDEAEKKVNKGEINSSSFSVASTKFDWANVKSKISYSFRALKANPGSDDGSRAISVKNLPADVTQDMLYDHFQDFGTITNVLVTRQAGRSGPVSAYVEFESGANARRAVQQCGKNLRGRVISCAIAYEKVTGTASEDSSHGKQHAKATGTTGSSHGKLHQRIQHSRGSGSSSGSSHGKEQQKPRLTRSGSAPSFLDRGLVEDNHSALQIFEPKLHEGDAKFSSRFTAMPYNGHGHFNSPPPGYPQPDSFPVDKARKIGGRTDLVVVQTPRSHGQPLTPSDRARAFVNKSISLDEPKRGWKASWPWRRLRKSSKWARVLWPWRKSRLHWWQFAKVSASKLARRKSASDNLKGELVKIDRPSVK